jgi:hypothetical protein
MLQAQLFLDGLAHVSELHKGGSCSIQHVIDGEWFEGISKPFAEVVADFNLIGGSDLPDTYITQQSILPFKKRCIENVYQLRSYWVDLDCYNVGLSKADALTEAIKIIKDKSLPKPRMIADSGRGLYLVWLLARPISTKKSVKNRHERLAAWQNTENLLIKTFASVGADPKASDPARVLRLAGSINSKSETPVQYWLSGHKLKSFNELSDALTAIQPDIKPKAKPVKNKAPRKTIYAVNRIANRFTLAGSRMADIKALSTLRGGLLRDYRERAIYIYSVEAAYFCRERETFLNSVSEFMSDHLYLGDNKYNPNTPEKYIKAVLDKCEIVNYSAPTFDGDARYKQKTSTIIKWLDITELEQRSLKTVINGAEKYKREKHRRRLNGVKPRDSYLADKKQQADDNAKNAIELRKQGFSVVQIMGKLNLSQPTVYRAFKGLR